MDDLARNSHCPVRNSKQEKMTKLAEVLKILMEEKFTGYIKVNFSQGGIGRIEKFEEILK
jgi:hypothetical protein